ncbi:PREDICTED: uncharacterized protein LOC109211574 [Nicotiana attenuata]|uniref:uncharacterized protein LOC109211574 n=1 Tax=Nicotiana attenuata TaxID=49451 RepID=UPI000904EE61|nr:PREDICTED: uncharacterized protein LOC109211574 [Nicotiana attenuata]
MNLKHKLGEIQDKLAEDLFNSSLINEEKEILIEMEKWGTIHERVIRQKSRATWISSGDSNTRFFHAHMKSRQARNKISSIQNEQGVLITDPKLIQQEFLRFFKKLLGTAAEEFPCIDTTITRNGIDGFPAEFFKANWNIIGEDIITAVMQFFENGQLLKEINCTIITLVPKVPTPLVKI